MCNMNKNHLLTLFFHECGEREEKEIRRHVDGCGECRDYLAMLESVHGALRQWDDETPPVDTLDAILAGIPQAAETQPAPAAVRSEPSFTPVLIIPLIGLILTFIFLLQDKIRLLPSWETLQASWLGQFLGSFGVAAAAVFLLGVLITLAMAPVLILERQTDKHGYNFT